MEHAVLTAETIWTVRGGGGGNSVVTGGDGTGGDGRDVCKYTKWHWWW